MRQKVGFLAAAILGVWVGVLYAQQREPFVKPARIAWSLSEGRFSDVRMFTVKFKDGRQYIFREGAITSAKLFPVAWAGRLNLQHPFLEVIVGGHTTRIDVPTTEAGEALLAAFQDTGKIITSSENWDSYGQN